MRAFRSGKGKQVVAVFGATGQLGGSVVQHLLPTGKYTVRGVTRSASSAKAKELAAKGVELVEADVSKPETFGGVFRGAHAAVVVTNFWDPSSMGKEFEQTKALADAAKAAGVEQFILLGLPNVEAETGGKIHVPHFTDKGKAYEYVKAAGFKSTTSVGPSFYFQNFLSFFPGKKEADGTYVYTLPETSQITAFDADDIGGLVAAVLAQPQRWNGDYLPASGDHLTPAEFVAQIGAATGKKTKLNAVPRQVFATFGFPGAKELADMFAWFDEFTFHGRLAKREETVRAFPQIKTFKQWLATGALKLE